MKILKPTAKLFFIAAALLFNYSGFAQQNSKKIKQLEKSLEEVMNLSNCPGMAVAVVKNNQIIYAKGFGYSDYENKKTVTANTLFAIGSCTKSFTAALVGQAEAKKQIDLDESPKAYVPALSFYNSEMNQFITIRDILTHRTGLPRHDISWYLFPTDSRDSLVQRIKYQEPTLSVREGYQYNNFMYMLAGNVVEKVSGESWENNVRNALFAPLEMNRSNLSIEELEKAEDVALGYQTKKDKSIQKLAYHSTYGMAPAGSINSSANDMGNWLITWINGGVYKGNEVIPSDFVQEAISSQIAAYPRMPSEKHPDLFIANYGFAWDISSYRGHYRVEHGGNIDGFTASTCFFPSDSIGIVVLVNQNYSSVQSLVRNMIADQMLGLPSGEWNKSLKERSKAPKKEEEEVAAQVSKRIPGTSTTHALESYAGQFNHKGYGTFTLSVNQDSLFAHLPEMQLWLRHNHYDVFEPFEVEEDGIDTTGGGSMYFNFHSNIDGDIDGVYLNAEQSLDPIFFKKEFVEMEVSTSDLEQYIGAYDLGGVEASVFVKENGLKLLVPGQPEYSLVPATTHKFVLKDLEGFSVEFEEKEGKITALTFMQPNGNFRVPKK